MFELRYIYLLYVSFSYKNETWRSNSKINKPQLKQSIIKRLQSVDVENHGTQTFRDFIISITLSISTNVTNLALTWNGRISRRSGTGSIGIQSAIV